MRSVFALFLALSAGALDAQPRPSFEVATVRPSAGPIPGVPAMFGQQRSNGDTLTIRHTALVEVIRRAYGVVEQELADVPGWVRTERFDIAGKSATPATDAELWTMVQGLLEERFQFRYHREPREVSGLALVAGKDGPRLKASEGGSNNISAAGGVITGNNVTLQRLAQILSGVMQRPVLDDTGLEETYDFRVDPKPYGGQGKGLAGLQNTLIIALQEELGLKLESRKFEIQVMVVDHVEGPSEN